MTRSRSAHKIAEMISQKLFEGLTSRELHIALNRRLQKLIPEPTYRRWRKESGIGTKEEYSLEDLDVLTVYAIALSRRRSKSYATQKLVEYLTHDENSEDCPDSTARTIEVECQSL